MIEPSTNSLFLISIILIWNQKGRLQREIYAIACLAQVCGLTVICITHSYRILESNSRKNEL